MPLDTSLITQFAKATKNKQNETKETILYGTIVVDQYNIAHVRLDGDTTTADEHLIPVSLFTAEVNDGDRVTVMIKNHSAIVTGNMSNQSVSGNYVKDAIKDIDVKSIDATYIQSLWNNYNN